MKTMCVEQVEYYDMSFVSVRRIFASAIGRKWLTKNRTVLLYFCCKLLRYQLLISMWKPPWSNTNSSHWTLSDGEVLFKNEDQKIYTHTHTGKIQPFLYDYQRSSTYSSADVNPRLCLRKLSCSRNDWLIKTVTKTMKYSNSTD